MYFNAFPKIYYDFPNYSGDDTFLQVLTDITANVRIRKQVLEDITLYDEYDMKEGETPEIIAEKYYGNPEYHWIILLANQRYDYISDFPLTSAELYEHTVNTYGVDHIYDIHHYERDGEWDEASGVLKVPSSAISKLKVHDNITDAPFTNARIESIDKTTNSVVVKLDYGRFKDGDGVTVNGIRYDTASKSNVYSSILNFVVQTNGFTLNDSYVPITNYDYENIKNEKKRRIKLISPRLIEQLLREYKSVMY